MVNIDYGTLLMISVPAFLIGIMTGRFLSSRRWQSINRRLGVVGSLLTGVAFLAYLAVTAIVLSVMVIYLRNFPDASKPVYYWCTLFFGLWMIANVIYELIDLNARRRDLR